MFKRNTTLYLLTIGILSSIAPISQAQETTLDGISVLISTSGSDQSSAIPILESDVDLILKLLLLNEHGPDWKTVELTSAMRFKARRMATLVQLLAHVSRLIGEELDLKRRDGIISRLVKKSGGTAAMKELLVSCGTGKKHLKYWVGNFLFAQMQLRYLREKMDPPSDTELSQMFKEGGHHLGDKEWKDAQREYRQMISDKQLLGSIDEWVKIMLERGSITFTQ